MLTRVGEILRNIRLNNGDILKDMADKLGVSSAFISAVENGKKVLPLKMADEIADIYELDENKKEELIHASNLSKKSLDINLIDASVDKRELALIFERRFENFDTTEVKKITKFLNDL